MADLVVSTRPISVLASGMGLPVHHQATDTDRPTYPEPLLPPKGIEHVLIIEHGFWSRPDAGRVLRARCLTRVQ